jgi:hypothetical protein
VLSRQGDSLFDQGRFIQAAQCYAKSSRSFEYVTLRFVDADERDALRIYLADRLDLLDKRVSYNIRISWSLTRAGKDAANDARHLAR